MYKIESCFLTSSGKSSIEVMVYSTGLKCQMMITKNSCEWAQNRFANYQHRNIVELGARYLIHQNLGLRRK